LLLIKTAAVVSRWVVLQLAPFAAAVGCSIAAVEDCCAAALGEDSQIAAAGEVAVGFGFNHIFYCSWEAAYCCFGCILNN
jgi:hypothetical protein